MKIKHDPVFNTDVIVKRYTEKDGVPCVYVCTTDLIASDRPADVFFRETPHPEFGNRYFGILWGNDEDTIMITNADIVETFDFGMVEVDDEYHYSQSHHDYRKFENGNMIDGGRVYIRASGAVDVFQIHDGKFVEEQ